MQFKTLQLKNFLSYQNETFTFGEGLFLLTGWNKDKNTANGSGKSSICDAICWALTGDTPRKILVDSLPHRDFPKGSEVNLVLVEKGKTYSIQRGRSPNFLNFMVNDQLKNGSTITDTQKIIEETLGISYRLFINSVYFPQGAVTQFLTANDNTKKDLLTELLDLSLFDRANEKISADLKKKQLLYRDISQKLEFYEKEIELKMGFYKKILSYSEDFELDRSNRIMKLSNDLSTATQYAQNNRSKIYDSMQATKERIGKIEGQISAFQQFIAIGEGQVNFDTEQLEKYLRVRDNGKQFADRLKQSGYERMKELDVEMARKQAELSIQEKEIHKKIEEIKRLEEMTDHHCQFCYQQIDRQVMGQQVQRMKNETHQLILTFQERKNSLKNDDDRRQLLINQLNQEYNQNIKEIEELQKHINKSEAEIYKLKNDLNEKINMVKNLCGALELEKSTLKNLYEKDASLGATTENEIKRIQKEIDEITHKKNEYTTQLTETDTQIQVLKEQQFDWKDNVTLLENDIKQLQFLQDGFGNKGIKAYVFERVVNEINLKTNDYINQLFDAEISIQFQVTNTKNAKGETSNKFETKIFMEDKEVELGSFSGGEKRRLILATDLALSQIIQNRTSKNINLLIFDEYFDGLDELGRERVMLLLDGMVKNNTILVIDHNTQFQNLFNKTIKVVKEGNVSKIDLEDY